MNKEEEIIDCAQLESVVKRIGCLVVAVIIFIIPCLAALSFALNWDSLLKYLLTIFSISMIGTMAAVLYDLID